MNKGGLSGIVSAVIMIGLVLAAVAIVWAVVSSLITEETEGVASCSNQMTNVGLNNYYTCYDETLGVVLIAVDVAAEEIDKLIISIYADKSQTGFEVPGSNSDVAVYGGAYGESLTKIDVNSGKTYVLRGVISMPEAVEISPVASGKQCGVSARITNIKACSGLTEVVSGTPIDSGIDDGLVLYLPFDVDGNLSDASGEGNDGINNGATWTADGKVGGAYNFDGDNSILRVPYDESFDFDKNDDFSIYAWINLKNYSDEEFIVIRGEADYSVTKYNYKIYVTGAHNLSVISSNASGQQHLVDNEVLELDRWHLVGMSYDSNTNVLTGYKNGEAFDSMVVSNISRDLGDLFIGNIAGDIDPVYQASVDAGYYMFNGLIDEVRVYNKVLSESEIQELYDQGSGGLSIF